MQFSCDEPALERKFASALEVLAANRRVFYGFSDQPVLIEGGVYAGVWLECAPHEGLVYGAVEPAIAVANHKIFFRAQRPDGYIPAMFRTTAVGMEVATGMLQTVIPLAATALETARLWGSEAFLAEAYHACARYDAWLEKHRDRRGLGLVEAFCEFDTGHDNSPRWRGLPHSCPRNDARICPEAGTLPYLAPDLSATLYGGRIALTEMARLLGRDKEAESWRAKANRTRGAIHEHCFDEPDLAFYDRDAGGDLVKICGDAMLRVLCEHVVDQKVFDAIYARHIRNPDAFWTPYPLPSIAANDPSFVKNPQENAWAGPSQALTALRAPRWFEHYGKFADLQHLMRQWLKALSRSVGFMQQMDPWTGEFNTTEHYSPAMLAAIDFVARCHGVTNCVDELHWTCVLPQRSTRSEFSVQTSAGMAVLRQRAGHAVASLGGKEIFSCDGQGRVVTDLRGRQKRLVGVDAAKQHIAVKWLDAARASAQQSFEIRPDEQIDVSAP